MKAERRTGRECLVCGSASTVGLLRVEQVPVHCNLLWPAREQALQAPRGEIDVLLCEECGHLFNASFRPELTEYGEAYENALHFSRHFQSYIRALADHLVARYELRGKDILEIGCGSGEFLELLCELGDNRGVGVDPSHRSEEKAELGAGRVTFVREPFGERHAEYTADLICCRQVLEHLHDPTGFLAMLRRMIGGRQNTAVFFEVPNGLAMLRDLGIWDLIYEHRSYFTPSSLGRAFASCGFEVRDLSEAYAGQFLTLEALPGDGLTRVAAGARSDPGQVADRAGVFGRRYLEKVDTWRRHVDRLARAELRVVVWGAGSKGVTFLNTLESESRIEYVVDINPRKQGMYVAGTGQEIVTPEFLVEYRPDVVIVVNPVYKEEIQERVETLGLDTEMVIA
jgi:SAM-dependent methyltransferase